MNERLEWLCGLPRPELLKEVRRAAELSVQGEPLRRLVFWETVAYGDWYEPVLAGPLTASFLGINVDDVVGYIIEHRVFDAMMALTDDAVVQNDPPYPDPFRPGGPVSTAPTEVPSSGRHVRAP